MKQPMGKRVSSLRRRDGFTLMEMLVVVIIISILAGVTLKLFKVNSNWQKKEITIQNLGKLRAAIEEYYAQYGTYPPVPRNNSNQQALGYECPAGNDYDPVNGSTYYMPVAQAQNIAVTRARYRSLSRPPTRGWSNRERRLKTLAKPSRWRL